MNEAPKGKIGRLPQAIQEQVNRRLENGERARTLVAWLNALPEVQAMLAAEFAGQPISEQNLSQWRKHGYKQWLWHHHAWEMTQATTSTPDQPLTDQMAGWVTAHYLLAIRQLVENSAGGEPDFKTLRALLHDVVAVRLGGSGCPEPQASVPIQGHSSPFKVIQAHSRSFKVIQG